MKIHPAGNKIVIRLLIVLILTNSLFVFLLKGYFTAKLIVAIISFLLLFGVAMFFRLPKRHVPELENGTVICPADGTIVVIEETMEPEYFKDMRKQVSIFMSLTNVHVNWYPINGIIRYVKYHAGKYLVAWHPKSSELNERNTIVVEGKDGEILLQQVAGFVARKIVSYAQTGDNIKRGDQIGMIKFGSRVDLYLPLDTEIQVNLDQKVRGGKTVIGIIPS
ncbi:MAG TPA: phosphatidylserine decarboxylase family protein [Bacteroidales bacterium]|nr:phosphatidylserine decarboxylase family protein [Bacteroidales bacterium]